MYDDDETLDDFATWLDKKAKARVSGRLSVDDAISAYSEYTGLDIEYNEAIAHLSSRFEVRLDELTGELLFYAVIYVWYNPSNDHLKWSYEYVHWSN